MKGTNNINAPRTTASRNRGRIMRTTSGRGRGGSVIMGSRPVVPAPYVPEELISQVLVYMYIYYIKKMNDRTYHYLIIIKIYYKIIKM